MSPLSVKIISPQKVFFDGQAEMVVCPGIEGEFGILPGHAHFLSELKKGKIRIKINAQQQDFQIESGFVEVASDKVTILVKS